MVPDGDVSVFEKIVYGIAAIVTWVGVRAYKIGGEVAGFKSELKDLRDDLEDQRSSCPHQQTDLYEKLSTLLVSSIDKNISAIVLDQTRTIAELNQRIALLIQSQENLTTKVNEISRQQRSVIVNPNDTGQRRRLSDLVDNGTVI